MRNSNVHLKATRSLYACIFCSLLFTGYTPTASASDNLTINVHGEEITLQRFPASGSQLILYVAPGYGFNDRGTATAQALSDSGIEVWMVDLLDNFFLPRSNEHIRNIDGRHVASIITQAHNRSGKNITLLSSSFGAIPVLRGARLWQQDNPALDNVYLNGAILFSPEFYQDIPALGEDPQFVPIISATNIPIMIYQSALRNNRWHLPKVVRNLEQGGATVYQKILPGIVAFFYQIDESPATLKILRELPAEIPHIIRMLESTPTPLKTAKLVQPTQDKTSGRNIKLRKYTGDKTPLPLDLENINGERIVRNDYTGKVTVVNFWATWCPPCVEEIPMLNRLIAQMKDTPFELISIDFGEEKAVIAGFLKKVNVAFPVLLDAKGRTSGDWNTVVLPSTYVIGPDGKFAYTVNAAIEWDSPEVVKALKQLASQ